MLGSGPRAAEIDLSDRSGSLVIRSRPTRRSLPWLLERIDEIALAVEAKAA
jgi:hypothetical protein